MKKTALLILAALAFSPAAIAQQMPYGHAITVGTSPQTILSANPSRKRLIFFNPNPVAKVAVCPIKVRTPQSGDLTCAVNGAGSITLLPYARETIDSVPGSNQIPSAFSAIADTGGSALTILEFE